MPSIHGNSQSKQPHLKGTLLPQDQKKIVTTASHVVTLSEKVDQKYVPCLKIQPQIHIDPKPKPKIHLKPSHIRTASEFERALQQEIKAQESYLKPTKEALWNKLPEHQRSLYAYNHIVGKRIEAFCKETLLILSKAELPPEEARKARKALNLIHKDLYRHPIAFDRADTQSYWPFSEDGVFVHIFEKLLHAMPEDDPKRCFIQAQIDYLFTHCYTPKGKVDEQNIEESLELIAIDSKSRHIASIDPQTDLSLSPSYVVFQYRGMPVYRDKNQYFFEDSHKALSKEEVFQLQNKPAEKIVFRRPKNNEAYRTGFRFDWDSNRLINSEVISSDWYGHCDVKALMESILADMQGCKKIIEYRCDTQTIIQFDRADILEALAAFLSFGDQYVPIESKPPYLEGMTTRGNYRSGGARYDEQPTKLIFETDQGNQPVEVELQALGEPNAPDAWANLEQVFCPKIVDSNLQSFRPNPNLIKVENLDTFFIDATLLPMKIHVKGMAFNAQGNVCPITPDSIINHTSSGPILVSCRVQDPDQRITTKTFINPNENKLFECDFQMIPQGDLYTEKAIPHSIRPLGTIKRILVGQEMKQNDDVLGKIKMIENAIQTGDKIAADNDPGPQVWNGEIHDIHVETEYRSPDGKWERIRITTNATFGENKVTRLINQLDEEGNIVDSCEIEAGVDFFWKSRPEIAPFIRQGSQMLMNREMALRGIIDTGQNMQISLAAIQDLLDLVYIGLSSKDGKTVYSIFKNQNRLLYDQEAKWKKDITRIENSPNPKEKASRRSSWIL